MKVEGMTLSDYVARQQARVDDALRRWVPPESTLPESIHKAMRYSLFAGGKRIRPILVPGRGGGSIGRTGGH